MRILLLKISANVLIIFVSLPIVIIKLVGLTKVKLSSRGNKNGKMV